MWKVLISSLSNGMSWEKADCNSEVEAQAWLNSQIGKPHRLPERIVSISDDYAQEDVLEVIESEVEQFDAEGNSLGMIMQQTHVRLKAQFTSEIVDISAQVALESAQAAARKLLADTDWYACRLAETGVEIPQEIKDQRAAARLLL